MDNLTYLTQELAHKIETSESRAQYLAAKSNVAENAPLTLKLKAFKQAQLDFQLKLMDDASPSFDEERHVSKLYADLLLDDDAKAFLDAERQLLTLVNQIQHVVNVSCGIVLDF